MEKAVTVERAANVIIDRGDGDQRTFVAFDNITPHHTSTPKQMQHSSFPASESNTPSFLAITIAKLVVVFVIVVQSILNTFAASSSLLLLLLIVVDFVK